jgi:hypothetical protein
MSIYEKPVWQLLIDFSNETLVLEGSTFTPQDATRWFHKKYPDIKKGTINAHIRMMSTNVKSRLHWSPSDHHNMFYSLGSGTYRIYRSAQDPPPIMSKDDVSVTSIESVTRDVSGEELEHRREYSGGAEFAFERDLQNYLVKNLESVESGLKLYHQDGITGVEYPVGGRRIDILAVDNQGDLVVIELKVSRGHDRVIGQILRYMGWIKQNLADDEQNVRGIIIAKDISDDLKWACSATQGITLKEYSLSFSLDKVS